MLGRKLVALGLAGSFIAATGCEQMKENRIISGTAIGAAGGAGAGALIGEATTGDAGKGAVIGGLLGAVVGAGVGAYLDKKERDLKRVVPAGSTVVQAPVQDPIQPQAPPAQALTVTISDQVMFPYNSYTLLPQARTTLDQIYSVIMDPAYPRPQRIVIVGHTDSTGDDNSNQVLSQQRAESVKGYFMSKGIPPEVLVAVGRGEQEPVATNDIPEGRAANRRVEIKIIPGQQ